MRHVISKIDELRRLIRSRKASDDSILLNLPFLDGKHNFKYAEQINKYRYSCGCDTGGYLLAFSSACCIALSVFRISVFDTPWVWQAIISLAVICLSTLIGKAAGLLYARTRLQLTVRSIEKAGQGVS